MNYKTCKSSNNSLENVSGNKSCLICAKGRIPTYDSC